jgi:hypothetical protein
MVKGNNYAHVGENPERGALGNKKTARVGGCCAWLRDGASGVHFALGSFVVVVLDAILVTHHLTVHFVDQFIHSGIQVSVGAFGEQVAALDVDVAFRSLPLLLFLLLLYCQQHFDIDNLVKVARDPVQLTSDVVAQGRGNFEVVTADRQVHK